MKVTKRIGASMLAGLLLVSCAACGKQEDLVEISGVPAGQIDTLIAAGEYEEAYLLLQKMDQTEAARWQGKLVFVPVEQKELNEDGEEVSVVTAVYDQQGVPQTVTRRDDGEEEVKATYTYNDAGLLTTQKDVSGEIWRLYEYTYNEQGILIGYHYTSSEGRDETTTFTLDEKGRMSSSEVVSTDGESIGTTYVYNADGRMVYCESKEQDGYWSKEYYTYDSNGNLTLYESSTSTGDWSKLTYTYDAAGKVQTYVYDSDGYTSTTNYIYNSQGQLEQEEWTTTYESVSQYKYEYDRFGNVTSVAYVTGGRVYSKEITTWKLFYYPDGAPEQVREWRKQGLSIYSD